MKQRLRNIGGYAGVIGVYALVTLPILLNFPPIWPDEVLFYSPAANLARGQNMGTTVLAGFISEIDRYTYWQPPGYFFFLSLVLRVVPAAHHFVAMRLFSWILGVVALLLGASILKRFAHGIGWGWLGLLVLATQVSFIQAANVGRMEMLSLVCTLAALNWYLAFRETPRGRLLAGASLMSGLAMVCHPVGILAAIVIVVHELAAPQNRRGKVKEVVLFLVCLLAPFVPWLIYIAQAPGMFSAQMLAQSARKSVSLGAMLTTDGFEHWVLQPFEDAIWPLRHPLGGPWPFTSMTAVTVQILMLGVGLAALLHEGRRHVEASLLGSWALAGYGIHLFLPEFWYAIHFSAPCCLLLGWVVAGSSRRLVRTLALVTLVLAAVLNLDTAKSLWDISQGGRQRYKLYCSNLARSIPPHSSVLLAAIPDPYFGLVNTGRDYRFYEFVPDGVPVEKAKVEDTLGRVDYVVGSICCEPEYLMSYLLAHGTATVDIGGWSFVSPPVTIWKLRPPVSIQARQLDLVDDK